MYITKKLFQIFVKILLDIFIIFQSLKNSLLHISIQAPFIYKILIVLFLLRFQILKAFFLYKNLP